MTMVLLPPSEGKTSATGKSKLNLAKLAFSQQNDSRERVLNSLTALSLGPTAKARTVLGISTKQDWEIERNQQLLKAPAAPAWQIYTGVLYEALAAESMSAARLKKLTDMTFIQSALFGLISLGDVIPAYRLSGDCVLPKVGSMSSVWSRMCTQILAERSDLVIDFRSGTYVKLGPLPIGINSVVPKILQRMPSGPPKVVSHHNKATKGRILRAIVEAKSGISNVDQLANVIASLGADVDVIYPKKVGSPVTLNVVVDVL